MREEIRNQNNELNEAALENVSGGCTDAEASELARSYCNQCELKGACLAGVRNLTNHIQRNGDIGDYHRCPFHF